MPAHMTLRPAGNVRGSYHHIQPQQQNLKALEGSNLMFEVEDKGAANNPEALYVALWEGPVPGDRAAEQYAALSEPRPPRIGA